MFGLFASGEMQAWARDPKYDIEIKIDPEIEKTPVTDLDKSFQNGLDYMNNVELSQTTGTEKSVQTIIVNDLSSASE